MRLLSVLIGLWGYAVTFKMKLPEFVVHRTSCNALNSNMSFGVMCTKCKVYHFYTLSEDIMGRLWQEYEAEGTITVYLNNKLHVLKSDMDPRRTSQILRMAAIQNIKEELEREFEDEYSETEDVEVVGEVEDEEEEFEEYEEDGDEEEEEEDDDDDDDDDENDLDITGESSSTSNHSFRSSTSGLGSMPSNDTGDEYRHGCHTCEIYEMSYTPNVGAMSLASRLGVLQPFQVFQPQGVNPKFTNISDFWAERSVYHRLSSYGLLDEFDTEPCQDCGFLFTVPKRK